MYFGNFHSIIATNQRQICQNSILWSDLFFITERSLVVDAKKRKNQSGTVLELFFQDSNLQVEAPNEDIPTDLQSTYSGPAPYHLNYCGYESCAPGYCFGPHTRTSYLIHIIFSGKGTYRTEGTTYHLSAGQLFLIYPGVSTVYQADEKDPWSYGWVGFSGYHSETILSYMGFSRDNHVVYVNYLEPLRQSIQNMLELHKITYGNELKRTAELLQLFSYVMDHSPNARETQYEYSKTTYAEVAMRYLTSNYPRRIKISDLADYIGVDRSYLTKSFREQYHVSPQEYLISLRMDQAQFLLENTGKSVTDIAAEVGYPDSLAFSKSFKQRFGTSPSEYRQYIKSSDKK